MVWTDNPVAVVDSGRGNLPSFPRAVRTAAADSGWQVVVTADPEVVLAANRVVLPGQGAMPDCMRELRESGLQDAVLHAAAKDRKSTRLNSSHLVISYAVFCLKKKK